MFNKMLKIGFVFFILILVLGQGCEDSDDSSTKESSDDKIEETSQDKEFDDGLDDALAELDELEDL